MIIINENKGNCTQEDIECLLIAAQNNVIRPHYIKAKIDKPNRIASVGFVVSEVKLLITL